MRNLQLAFTVIVLVLLSAVACGRPPEPTLTPTATIAPTGTPPPTETFTPEPTETQVPTRTPKPTNTSRPTSTPTSTIGEVQIVEEGGFSFRAPTGYDVDVQDGQVGVFDKDGTIIISFFGSTSNPQNKQAEEIADEFLEAVFKRGDGDYEIETSYPITVGGFEGLGYDLTGTLFGAPTRGQAVIVMPSDEQFLFGLGIANLASDAKRWEDEGSRAFGILVDSITFSISEGASANGKVCVVSTDDTYGHTKENPIKVGGGAFDGPSRERAYLDNLLGPKGENITYERNGSVSEGDAILDVFEVRLTGQTVTLYIDEYTYAELQAPVGFTCAGAFPLSQP